MTLLNVQIGPQKNFLRQIFCSIHITQPGPPYTEYFTIVLLNKFAESFHITVHKRLLTVSLQAGAIIQTLNF